MSRAFQVSAIGLSLFLCSCASHALYVKVAKVDSVVASLDGADCPMRESGQQGVLCGRLLGSSRQGKEVSAPAAQFGVMAASGGLHFFCNGRLCSVDRATLVDPFGWVRPSYVDDSTLEAVRAGAATSLELGYSFNPYEYCPGEECQPDRMRVWLDISGQDIQRIIAYSDLTLLGQSIMAAGAASMVLGMAFLPIGISTDSDPELLAGAVLSGVGIATLTVGAVLLFGSPFESEMPREVSDD